MLCIICHLFKHLASFLSLFSHHRSQNLKLHSSFESSRGIFQMKKITFFTFLLLLLLALSFSLSASAIPATSKFIFLLLIFSSSLPFLISQFPQLITFLLTGSQNLKSQDELPLSSLPQVTYSLLFICVFMCIIYIAMK